MFKEITIQTQGKAKVNVGQISEALLFYNKVNVLSSNSLFDELAKRGDLEGFKNLIQNERLNLLIEENHLGRAHSENSNGWFSFLYVQGSNVTPEDLLVRQLNELTGRPGYSRRTARSIYSKANVFKNENSVINDIIMDLEDEEYMRRVIYYSIKEFAPHININLDDIKSKLRKTNGLFKLETNISYDKLNEMTGSSFDDDFIIGDLINARLDSFHATKYNSDIHTSEISSKILQNKIQNLLSKTEFNWNQIELFNEYVLSGKTIKNVINSGQKNLEDLCAFLDKSEKFKSWLNQVDEDKGILNEYITAIGKESFMQNGQVKTFKWYFFQTLAFLLDISVGGLASTFANLALSIGDQFIIDKLCEGWKPNFFVDTDLKGFTK